MAITIVEVQDLPDNIRKALPAVLVRATFRTDGTGKWSAALPESTWVWTGRKWAKFVEAPPI